MIWKIRFSEFSLQGRCSVREVTCFCWFVCFLFCLFRTAPAAYGSSQARGWISAAAASLHLSHSNNRPMPQLVACGNSGSSTHWARPGIESHPQRDNVGSLTCWASVGTPGRWLVLPKDSSRLVWKGYLDFHRLSYWFFVLSNKCALQGINKRIILLYWSLTTMQLEGILTPRWRSRTHWYLWEYLIHFLADLILTCKLLFEDLCIFYKYKNLML